MDDNRMLERLLELRPLESKKGYFSDVSSFLHGDTAEIFSSFYQEENDDLIVCKAPAPRGEHVVELWLYPFHRVRYKKRDLRMELAQLHATHVFESSDRALGFIQVAKENVKQYIMSHKEKEEGPHRRSTHDSCRPYRTCNIGVTTNYFEPGTYSWLRAPSPDWPFLLEIVQYSHSHVVGIPREEWKKFAKLNFSHSIRICHNSYKEFAHIISGIYEYITSHTMRQRYNDN